LRIFERSRHFFRSYDLRGNVDHCPLSTEERGDQIAGLAAMVGNELARRRSTRPGARCDACRISRRSCPKFKLRYISGGCRRVQQSLPVKPGAECSSRAVNNFESAISRCRRTKYYNALGGDSRSRGIFGSGLLCSPLPNFQMWACRCGLALGGGVCISCVINGDA